MIAYSENMSAGFMQALCPSARLRMKCNLFGCRLVLRRIYGSAEFSVERSVQEDYVPIVIWEISETDEKDLLDFYPEELFEKCSFSLDTGKSQLDAFLFVLWSREPALPDEEYIKKSRRRMRSINLISGSWNRRWMTRQTV